MSDKTPISSYFLFILSAGFSFGGMLAYEMASQLVEQDEEVAMVWMLDTYPWFPKFLPHARQFSLSRSHLFLQNADDILVIVKPNQQNYAFSLAEFVIVKSWVKVGVLILGMSRQAEKQLEVMNVFKILL